MRYEFQHAINAYLQAAKDAPAKDATAKDAAKGGAKNAEANGESSAAKSPGAPSKVVVRNGGARENAGQLEPGVTTAAAEQQRATTAQLLAATDANLKRVEARSLTRTEQSTMEEIRTYVRQAKKATDLGDTSRAYLLANKARLLSDSLAGK